MKPGIAFCLFSGLVLAACGDDEKSSADASTAIDAKPADAAANTPDANPAAPDANVDAMPPAGPVREETCVGVPNLTISIASGSSSAFVYAPNGDKDKLPLGAIVRFETPGDHDVTSGSNATADNKFRVATSQTKCFKFVEANTYDFYCSIHPGIRGSIKVLPPP